MIRSIFFLIIFFSLHLNATDSVSNEMREKIKFLDPEHSFYFVDLKLSKEEHDLFEKFVVDKQLELQSFGHIKFLHEEIPQFLKDIGNNDEEIIVSATQTIIKIVTQFIEVSSMETAYVMIRSFIPMTKYDISN